ncbi:hypothetical protein C874_14835 [Elizabethkingia anophelis 502]|nr:hypothetical protein C874_14835 [Elizabethkingia anophelis 502]
MKDPPIMMYDMENTMYNTENKITKNNINNPIKNYYYDIKNRIKDIF